MSEINKLTVNGRAYDLADADAREQLHGLARDVLGVVCSQNCLPMDYYDGDYKENYGITYEKQPDGTVTATGTATNTSRYYFAKGAPVKAGTYTLSGVPDGDATKRNLLYVLHTSDNGSVRIGSGSKTFTLEEDSLIWVYVEYGIGSAAVKDQQWRVMLERGDTAHPFVSPNTTLGGMQKDIAEHAARISGIDTAQQKLSGDLLEQSKKIDKVESNVFSLYGTDYEQGFLGVSGKINANGIYRTTKPIFVRAGVTIRYKLRHGTTLPIIALYADAAATQLTDSVTGINGVSKGEYTTPGAGYIRFTELMAHTDGYVCFTEAIPDNVRRYVDSISLGKKILCLGDSIFGNDGEIAEYLEQLTGTDVVLGAIGGTRVSIRPGTDPFQYLDGENLVQALVSGDWTAQDSAVNSLRDTYKWLPDRIAALKVLDMSTVDLVIMNWGTNDYTGGKTLEDICAAYNTVIDALQSTYPQLRILITTPIWRYFSDTENGDNKVYTEKGGNATLREIAEAIESFAKEKRISVLNAYQNMPLCYNTASTYFDAGSGVHLNAKGNMVYAHLLNGKIRSIY